MARAQRDYAAEYARRVQKERDRATAEGREFDLRRARGHATGRARDRDILLGRLRYWTKASQFDLPADEWRQDVESTIQRLTRGMPGVFNDEVARLIAISETIDELKAKVSVQRAYRSAKRQGSTDEEAAQRSGGRDRWANRIGFLPWALYFYHGGIETT